MASKVHGKKSTGACLAGGIATVGGYLALNNAFAPPMGSLDRVSPPEAGLRGSLAADRAGANAPGGNTSHAHLAGLSGLAVVGMVASASLVGSRKSKGQTVVKAFESELGVQAPVGFWDPAGLSKDGDVAAFKRRRATEIKHGRVSMIACIGYIVPEYVKFPGFLAPKEGIAFADVPNGLAALSKVPGGGWAQIIAFVGSMEFNFLGLDDSRDPGDYANCGKLGLPFAGGIDDEAKRSKSLNAEIANGRLAMMAIIGMFYQDGLTGSAWGDWSLYTDSPLR